jgi:hypothetical protein
MGESSGMRGATGQPVSTSRTAGTGGEDIELPYAPPMPVAGPSTSWSQGNPTASPSSIHRLTEVPVTGPSTSIVVGSSSGIAYGAQLSGPATAPNLSLQTGVSSRRPKPGIHVPTGLSTSVALKGKGRSFDMQVNFVYVPEEYGGIVKVLGTNFDPSIPPVGEEHYKHVHLGRFQSWVEGMPTKWRTTLFTTEEYNTDLYNQYRLLESCLAVEEWGETPWGIRRTPQETISPSLVTCHLDWEKLSPTKVRVRCEFMAMSCVILLNVEVYARITNRVRFPPCACRNMWKDERPTPQSVVETLVQSGVTVEEVRDWSDLLVRWAGQYVATHGEMIDPNNDIVVVLQESHAQCSRWTITRLRSVLGPRQDIWPSTPRSLRASLWEIVPLGG